MSTTTSTTGKSTQPTSSSSTDSSIQPVSSSRRGQPPHKRGPPSGSARRHHNWFDTFFDDPFINRFFPTSRFVRGTESGGVAEVGGEKTPDFIPPTDVSETDRIIRIACDVPGLSKQDVKIDLDEENRILTLSGEIHRDKQEENETYHSLERVYGSFRRSVYLPQDADLTGIKARVENGVLRVTVPKIEQTTKKVKTISVE
ncbi:hypothetical protein FDP41_001310 [Naegleria fowleri]|uniref:SHSP domain-containing protein n=1 Tax=Naegleria fowleri TaxID=5763 RepID=A0A6A5BYF2_NAEFO|nr:uncharacterized protein FDP41_001310 [Naegleria fowleri]KAF0979642.1 hypothetical protein FDP41_001310 [Naegleria fowleri]CAG4719635.1 unnamed protein product [Naegleria fowleri]